MTKKSKFFEPLALAVANGSTIKAASDSIGCKLQTAYNITCQPEFRQRVTELRRDMTFAAVGLLSDGAAQAVRTLTELLAATNEPAIRLQASKAILAALPSISEFGELRERIDALESQAPPQLKAS